jgi:hypothetical protein
VKLIAEKSKCAGLAEEIRFSVLHQIRAALLAVAG